MNCTFAKLLLSPIIPEVAHEMDCLDRERFLHTVIPKYIHKKNTPRHRQRGGQRRKRKNTAVDGVQRKAGGGVQREKGVERELELEDFIRIAVMVQSKLVFAKLLMN